MISTNCLAAKERVPRALRRQGFTLLELLVVIAIIAILAGILIPVFAQAKEQGRSTTCQSNLKQQALALMQYAQAYDDRLPYWFSWEEQYVDQKGIRHIPGVWSTYRAMIMPYVRSQNVFRCPSDTGWIAYTLAGEERKPIGTLPDYDYNSYLLNSWAGAVPTLDHEYLKGIAGRRISTIAPGTKVVMVLEWCASIPITWHYKDRESSQLHDTLSNLAFMDGHVKLKKIWWNGQPNYYAWLTNPPKRYGYMWYGRGMGAPPTPEE